MFWCWCCLCSAMFWMFGHWAAQLTGVCSVHWHWTGHCCTVAHSLEISRLDIQRTRHGHETSTVLMKGPRPENKMWNATFECLIIARLQSSSCGRASSIQPSDCFLACYNLPLPLNLVSFETLAGLRLCKTTTQAPVLSLHCYSDSRSVLFIWVWTFPGIMWN